MYVSAPTSIVLVSAGLQLDGGGTATVGRLLAGALVDIASETGLQIEALNLGCEEDVPQFGLPIRHFRGNVARFVGALAGIQARRRAAAIVFDHLGPARVQTLIPAPWRTPYLVYLHGIEVWGTLGWQRQRALRLAVGIMVNSKYTALRAGLDRRSLNWSLVPPVLEDRSPEGRVDDVVLARAGRGFVLIVGRMAAAERYKGHDSLIEALPGLTARIAATKLVVVGDGDDRIRLRRKAVALGVAHAVFFTGFVNEATREALYERAGVFVLPSRDEGFGVVFLEAMRAGLPCIALRDSAAAEIVDDGITGLLLDGPDPCSLERVLGDLLMDPGRAHSFGEEGRRSFAGRYKKACFRADVKSALAGTGAVQELGEGRPM